MGILCTVSLPRCSITLYRTEWVNMILNYCFWCHSWFLFSEDLCPVGENATIHGHTRRAYAEFDLLHKTMWISVFEASEDRCWKGVSEDVKLFRLINLVRSLLNPLIYFHRKLSEPFQIVSGDFASILTLPKTMWVRDPLSESKQLILVKLF